MCPHTYIHILRSIYVCMYNTYLFIRLLLCTYIYVYVMQCVIVIDCNGLASVAIFLRPLYVCVCVDERGQRRPYMSFCQYQG